LGSLEIKSVTAAQLIAMGDGALAAGQVKLARELYRVAMTHASAQERQPIRTRQGLAAAPVESTAMQLRILAELEARNYSNPFVSEGLVTWFKTLPFAADEKFQDLAEKHGPLLPIPNWHWNLQTVLWAIQRNRSVPGDYVELGVFKGHTTLFCSEYVGFQDWPKQWWLYDTFDGIPDDQVAPGWEDRNNSTYKGTYSYEEVEARFSGFPNIHVMRGKVPDILQESCPDEISFLHIDLNNAPAELAALDALYDRISAGGIIILDDYCWASTRLQYEAERKWFGRRNLHVLPMPTGQGVFIKP
jgi:hypothetical protein